VVAALNQAFIGKDPTSDLTSILADARTLEPTYDLAAAAGITTPARSRPRPHHRAAPPPNPQKHHPEDGSQATSHG